MITFITKKEHKVKEVPDELQIKDTLTPEDLSFISSLTVCGLDTEDNGLDPYIHDVLLLIVGDENQQYVIDTTYDNPQVKEVLEIIKSKITLGANLKFDYKMLAIKYGVKLERMFDVMIAEQRLLQGRTEFSIKYNKRVALSSALDKIVERRLKFKPSGMDKTIRDEFIGVNKDTFKFENKHIVYAANDIQHLFPIREIQKAEIAERKQGYLVYNIEFPLIGILADAELEGLNINEEKWKENIKNNKENKFNTEVILDQEVRNLREKLLNKEDRQYLSNGKFDRVRRKKVETEIIDLFGEVSKITEKSDKDIYTNYGSTDQIVSIFGRLRQIVPTLDEKDQNGPYRVPTFTKSSNKPTTTAVSSRNGKTSVRLGKVTVKYKVDKAAIAPYRFTTGEKAMDSYLIDNSNSPMKKFIEELINLRGYNAKLNTFGEEFLFKYKNRITKRYHTIYRQCHAVTGRLQSGDEDNGWYNSQNIPKETEYRECFYSGDDYIITTDLSGAEAVIMIDKAKDEKFYQIAIVNDDAHSPLATAVWRAIGKYRLQNGITRENHNKTPSELANITISKKENKDIRTVFKNYTFASIYGCGIKKTAKMLNISDDEAKIAGSVMKVNLPKTFKMVESNEKFALEHGFLVLNYRTNSRIWYSQVLDAKRNQSDLMSNEAHEVKNSARNAAIQGTQADMLKELMVEIHKEATRQDLYRKYNFALLKQVHDETVYRCNNVTDLIEFKPDGINVPTYVTIPEFIKLWHSQVPNRYLGFIKMTAEQHVGKTWTK